MQVANETEPQSAPEVGASADEAQATAGMVRTPEQVEAEWAAKQSALGRQYAAETKALRQRIDALEAERKAPGQRVPAEDDAVRQENELLRKQLVERERTYAAEMRRARFPLAAEALDDTTLASMDEAKLAGLEARLTPQVARPAPVVVSPTAPREMQVPKPIHEKTSAELKADLARDAEAFARDLLVNKGY
jgi:hypothetical protein